MTDGGDKETSQDLLQDVDKHKIQKVLGVWVSPDVKGDILDLRPNSQQGKWWNLRDRKDQREILWLIRKKRPKLVIGMWQVHTVLYSLVP